MAIQCITTDNKMKKFFAALAASLCLALAFAPESKAQLSTLGFGDYRLVSVTPASFTSLDGVMNISISNPGKRITITGISGMVYKDGIPFLIGKADDLVILPGTNSVNVSGHASLQSMTALFALLANPTIDPSRYTFDVTAEVTVRHKSRTVVKKAVPLSYILKAM